ncbi:uncharacterized protein LOC129599067 [Paramacrobiotus metropolitanus]|uniref:uncharacterized protein LOC129599067 n=1 Tax=Paramacrobiotus metropolitanus TaxID=2943436 RepID=UPI002446314B|nr:uncharacterized protein LOC129599067 [Paramacrobiotus metropolitanus]
MLLFGTRYKCLGCPNYDLCESCMLKGYHSQHSFLVLRTTPIGFDTFFQSAQLEKIVENTETGEGDTEPWGHEVICDECRAYPIIGTQFRCMLCEPSYDLCAECMAEGYHTHHDFLAIRTPDSGTMVEFWQEVFAEKFPDPGYFPDDSDPDIGPNNEHYLDNIMAPTNDNQHEHSDNIEVSASNLYENDNYEHVLSEFTGNDNADYNFSVIALDDYNYDSDFDDTVLYDAGN